MTGFRAMNIPRLFVTQRCVSGAFLPGQCGETAQADPVRSKAVQTKNTSNPSFDPLHSKYDERVGGVNGYFLMLRRVCFLILFQAPIHGVYRVVQDL